MAGKPPIILIGMHRSGTTMLTRVLESLGLFVGAYLDENHESLFFANLNNWLMRQCGAEWVHPEPFHSLIKAPHVRAWMVKRLTCFLHSPRVLLYLGASRYLRWRTPFRLARMWGWKDPRNTYTLPLWLALFPEAKVVHIYRHGVDVAQSLKMRAERQFSASQTESYRMDWLRVRPREVTNTIRCLQLEGGFSLWEEYMTEARQQIDRLGNHVFEIQYEALLEDPLKIIETLTEFCDLPHEIPRIKGIVERLHKHKAYNYRANPDLTRFAKTKSARLKMWGYST